MSEKTPGILSLGIDVGSTTVKVVLMEGDKILYQGVSAPHVPGEAKNIRTY